MITCKNCLRSNHPHYDQKYGGYCLDCSNAGVPERDAKIAKLEAAYVIRQSRGWYTVPIRNMGGAVLGWELRGGPEELALVVNADLWYAANVEGK